MKWPGCLSPTTSAFLQRKFPRGRQFRFQDGAIANIYDKGTVVWQGKETPTSDRVKRLFGRPVSEDVANAVRSVPETTISHYGHDIACREQLELLLRRMKLEPVILQNLPISGDTIIEKLESNIDVRYACVLLTPDDEGYKVGLEGEKKLRARQNVILELGMFLVRLGRKMVAILHKSDLELPSDISGLIYVRFNNRVDEVKEKAWGGASGGWLPNQYQGSLELGAFSVSQPPN